MTRGQDLTAIALLLRAMETDLNKAIDGAWQASRGSEAVRAGLHAVAETHGFDPDKQATKANVRLMAIGDTARALARSLEAEREAISRMIG